jgi:hypothetical protein
VAAAVSDTIKQPDKLIILSHDRRQR